MATKQKPDAGLGYACNRLLHINDGRGTQSMKMSPDMAERISSMAESSSDESMRRTQEAVIRFLSQNNRKAAYGCMVMLSGDYKSRAILSYFRDADIAAMQANFHQAMLITVFFLHMGPVNRHSYAASMGYCLLSGNPELIGNLPIFNGVQK